MPVNLDSGLMKTKDALQLAEGDREWASLLQPPLHPTSSGGGAEFPSDEGSQRQVICPELYRATASGSIDRVNELLGPTEVIERTYKIHPDVKVLLEDAQESKRSNKDWGGRVHGEGLCTLQEITAEKNTVLHIAAEQGHVELVEQIIHRDSTLLLSQNSRHETPLHLAARAGNCHIVSLIVLLAQESGTGAYEVLTRKSTEGDTVLHEAARHGHEEIVQLLMAVAPALSAEVNNASMSPLYLAVVRNSIGVVKALLHYSHTSTVGPKRQNALHAAVLGNQEVASMLLDWRVDLAIEGDDSGSTPMHYAASSGNVTAAKNILEKAPFAVYIQDQELSSPLHVAARTRNYAIISFMIDYCPDSFELRDRHGWNFLHIVAQHGGTEMKLKRHDLKKLTPLFDLFSRSPDLQRLVNERDNEGNTPLHFASMNGFSEFTFKLLQKTKADPTLMNNEGKMALDYAVSLNNFFLTAGVIATLSAYGAIFSPQRQDKLKNWANNTTQFIDKVSENLIVVYVLIATIAFSAAFNVPGSYNEEGVANLHRVKQYKIFIILDTIAMSASVSAAMLLVVAKAVGKRGSWFSFFYSLLFLWISLFTMELAFVFAVSITLGGGQFATVSIICAVSTFFFFWTAMAIWAVGYPAKLGTIIKFLFLMKEQTQTTRQIDIHFPMLVSTIWESNMFIVLNLLFYLAVIILWIIFEMI